MKTRTIYRFGDFRLNPATHELLRGDDEVALPPKAFGCLAYLIENRDRAVGRDEMISAVWGRVDCTDNVVGRSIFEIRRALGESSEEPQYIKSVRSIGYRWVARVEVETLEAGESGLNQSPSPRQSVARYGLAGGVVLLAVMLVIGGLWLWRDNGPGARSAPSVVPAQGNLALLLPVELDPTVAADHSWIRLGLMDLIATRLRAAGQATVPSDTVIALLRGLQDVPDPQQLQALTSTTGAGLVLASRAQSQGSRWRVSVRTLTGAQPPLAAAAESHDVLEATRMAVDDLVRSLGLVPTADTDDDAELTRLLQQLRAHILAQETGAARELLARAGTRLADHPKVRFKRVALEFESNRLDEARGELASLLDEPEIKRDPVFHARLLHASAVIRSELGELDAAIGQWQQAARILDGQVASDVHGLIYRHLGAAILRHRRDLDQASVYVAKARRIFEASGDIWRLGTLDLDAGLIERHRNNHPDSLKFFQSAAERLAVVQDVGSELLAHAHIVRSYYFLLDPQSALEVETRVVELTAAMTSRPRYLAWAHLVRLYAYSASGQRRNFDTLKSELLSLSDSHVDLRPFHAEAMTVEAEQALAEGDYAAVIELVQWPFVRWSARELVSIDVASVARILVDAHLAMGNEQAALAIARELAEAKAGDDTQEFRVNRALIDANIAAAGGAHERAAAGYEHALSAAGNIPVWVLLVLQSYVPWLLDSGPDGVSDPERALVLADRLAVYADRHYAVALLHLRVYHATGPVSAWRSALNRAQALAGEREIPTELLMPPQPVIRVAM